MSEFRQCFICAAKVDKFYTITTSHSSFTNTPFAQCLAQILDDTYYIVLSENDVMCEECKDVINERDKLTKVLADNLKKKYNEASRVEYPVIEIQTNFHNEDDDSRHCDNVEYVDINDVLAEPLELKQHIKEEEIPLTECINQNEISHNNATDMYSQHALSRLKTLLHDDINKVHTDDESDTKQISCLICDICSLSFTFSDNLAVHMITEHFPQYTKCKVNPEDHLQCNKCYTLFSDMNSFQSHLLPNIRGIENYCTVCEQIFSSDELLKKHIVMKHQNTEDTKDSVKVIYGCKCCGVELYDYQTFGHHRRRHKPISNKENAVHDASQTNSSTGAGRFDNSIARKKQFVIKSTKSLTKKEREHDKALQKKKIEVPDTSICLDDGTTTEYANTDSLLTEGKNKIFECGLCAIRLDNPNELREHFKTHTNFKVQCKECHIVLYSASEFKQHQNYHWKQGTTWTCNTCKLTCMDKFSMITHMKEIHGYKYDCIHCEEQFRTKLNLVKHIRNHPENKKFVCTDCGARFSKLFRLEKHIFAAHTSPICIHCSTQFPNVPALKKHECPFDESRPKLQCSYCTKEFKSRSGLKDHELSHTGNHKHTCSECNKHFVSKRRFEEHKNAEHSENPKTMYTCDTCGKHFLFLHSLINHKRTHQKPFSYTCEYCGQIIKVPGFVKIHLRKHTGERPFKCLYCPKAYTNGSYLRRHMMGHTKQYAYECQDCGKGFTDRKPYLKHREKDHADYSGKETCALCNDMSMLGKNLMFIMHRHKVHGEPMPKKVATVRLADTRDVKAECTVEDDDTSNMIAVESKYIVTDMITPDHYMDVIDSISQTVEIVEENDL